jgi:nucleoside-diphosphate-sugar epimerase
VRLSSDSLAIFRTLIAQYILSPQVKRIVITSSNAAILPGPPGPETRVLDESVWNEGSPKAVKENGRDASASDKYKASKTLAEQGKTALP